MTELARIANNSTKLTELYPTFRERIRQVIRELEVRGLKPRIQEAYRSPADQLKAFNSGHSKLKVGFHNITSSGGSPEALAVDLLDNVNPLNAPTSYYLQVAAAAEAQGLGTGVRWGLAGALKGAVERAIKGQDWEAPVQVGWDPSHIEPQGFTVEEAVKGKRP